MWHRRQAGAQLRWAQGIGWMWLLPANNLPVDTNARPQDSTLAVKGERQSIFTRCSTSVWPGIEDREIAVDTTTTTLGALAAYYSLHAILSDAVLAGPSCLCLIFRAPFLLMNTMRRAEKDRLFQNSLRHIYVRISRLAFHRATIPLSSSKRATIQIFIHTVSPHIII